MAAEEVGKASAHLVLPYNLNTPDVTMDKSVSLIIPVKDPDQRFQKCLAHIARCNPSPMEVIIVLDGDRGQPIPTADMTNLRTIRLHDTGGPGRARNTGAREARGDILLFIDADVLVPADILRRIRNDFAGSVRPDAVFGSYDDKPPAGNHVSQYKNLLHHFVHQNASPDAFTFWTGCGAILRKRFLEVDGFSEEYRQPSIEDIELGYRLKEAGATILLDKTIQVTHLKQWTLPDLLRTDFLRRALPWSRLILRSGPMHNDMNINMAGRVSVILSWLIIALLLLIPVDPLFAWGAALSFLLLFMLNKDLFFFFREKKGVWFMLGAIPLHFLYFLTSGLAFALALARHLFGASPVPARDKTKSLE